MFIIYFPSLFLYLFCYHVHHLPPLQARFFVAEQSVEPWVYETFHFVNGTNHGFTYFCEVQIQITYAFLFFPLSQPTWKGIFGSCLIHICVCIHSIFVCIIIEVLFLFPSVLVFKVFIIYRPQTLVLAFVCRIRESGLQIRISQIRISKNV